VQIDVLGRLSQLLGEHVVAMPFGANAGP